MEPNYCPDMADLIDKPEEILAEDLGVTIPKAKILLKLIDDRAKENQALMVGKVLGFLIQAKNQPAMIYAFCIAAGLDQLNDIETESEVAERLGVTRSLISHYVCGARDILSGKEVGDFDIVKFRKKNDAREVYAEKTKSKILAAKRKFIEQHQTTK